MPISTPWTWARSSTRRVVGGGTAAKVVWREAGGPPVSPPSRSGAGTRLIRAGLSGTVSSEVTVEFERSGIVCRIEADLASMGEEPE
jgi:two-component sensor histidine kinase